MNGFDDFDTQVTAEEFYDGWTDDEADYQSPVQSSGDEMYQTRYDLEAVQQEDAVSHTWEYEDHMAQWDNDPSPYDGTYSEE